MGCFSTSSPKDHRKTRHNFSILALQTWPYVEIAVLLNCFSSIRHFLCLFPRLYVFVRTLPLEPIRIPTLQAITDSIALIIYTEAYQSKKKWKSIREAEFNHQFSARYKGPCFSYLSQTQSLHTFILSIIPLSDILFFFLEETECMETVLLFVKKRHWSRKHIINSLQKKMPSLNKL